MRRLPKRPKKARGAVTSSCEGERCFGLERRIFEPAATMWTPEEVFEKGTELVFRADVPGMKREDVTVELTDGYVTLRGERKQEKEQKKDGYHRAKRTYGSFYRI